MKSNKYLQALVILLCILISCKKFIEVSPPVDRLVSKVVFTDAQTAKSAILGIYVNMMSNIPMITSGGTTLYLGLASDEIYSTDISDVNKIEFFQNSISPNNKDSYSHFWFRGYNIIYHANACIEALSNNVFLSKKDISQLLGEALFCRAFIYFYLTNLYGDVPLILGTDYIKNGKEPRATTSEVYEQILADLKLSQELLDNSYPSTNRVRPNKWAATALLSRVYLYLGEWGLAEREATSIINNQVYALESDLDNVFLYSSKEAIWQLMPSEEGFNTIEGFTFVPYDWSLEPPAYPLTDGLLNTFDSNDLRKEKWIGEISVNGDTYYYPFKYKINDYGLPVTEYYMVFRLAEQYLIRAECDAHQGKLDEALADINTIRGRAGLQAVLANNQDELFELIANEKRKEFFAEWGHRWFDLKRTQKSTLVLGEIKPGWQPADTLFPIPLSEILSNPSLTQNKGY